MGSILKTPAAFLRNQASLWEKKEISQQANHFQTITGTEWARISTPLLTTCELSFQTLQKLMRQLNLRSTKNPRNIKTSV